MAKAIQIGDNVEMSGGSKQHRQEKAIVHLLAEDSIAAAAAASGISTKTLSGWLNHDAEFKLRYQEAKQSLISEAIKELAKMSTVAVSSLHDLAINAQSENVRLGACRAILEMSIESLLVEQLRIDVAELERRQRSGGQKYFG